MIWDLQEILGESPEHCPGIETFTWIETVELLSTFDTELFSPFSKLIFSYSVKMCKQFTLPTESRILISLNF